MGLEERPPTTEELINSAAIRLLSLFACSFDEGLSGPAIRDVLRKLVDSATGDCGIEPQLGQSINCVKLQQRNNNGASRRLLINFDVGNMTDAQIQRMMLAVLPATAALARDVMEEAP